MKLLIYYVYIKNRKQTKVTNRRFRMHFHLQRLLSCSQDGSLELVTILRSDQGAYGA